MYAKIVVKVSLQETNTEYYYNNDSKLESASEFIVPVEVASAIDYTTVVQHVVTEVQEKYQKSLQEKSDKKEE